MGRAALSPARQDRYNRPAMKRIWPLLRPRGAFGALLLVLLLMLAAVTLAGGGARRPSTALAAPAVDSPPVVIERTFWSQALGRTMPYTVYLPQGYASHPGRRYPVLYMLHGLGGDHRQWERNGLFRAATRLVRSGAIPPIVIVTPEGERGYWVDHADNGPRYGTYVTRDLVSAVDASYRTVRNRAGRAIGGLSMGGHGALQLALNNPDEFAAIGAHSVALRKKEQAFSFFGNEQYFQAHDPVTLCAKRRAVARRFKIWIDIGDRDPWYKAAAAFHEQLDSEAIPNTWRVYPGGHDSAYWSAHVADYLRFYGQALTPEMAPATASPSAAD